MESSLSVDYNDKTFAEIEASGGGFSHICPYSDRYSNKTANLTAEINDTENQKTKTAKYSHPADYNIT